MFDAESLVRWSLAPALALAGAAIALATRPGLAAARRWAGAAACGASLLAGVAMFGGLRRISEQPRLAALPPTGVVASASAMGSSRSSGVAFKAWAPAGGEETGKKLIQAWEQIGHVEGAAIDARELCGRFPQLPLWCSRPGKVDPSVTDLLRRALAGSGVPEVGACPEGEGGAIFVSDRLDDFDALALDVGARREVLILGQTVGVTVSRRAEGRTDVAFVPVPHGASTVAPASGDAGAPIRLALTGGRVRLRAAYREAPGTAQLRLYDIHLECP